CLNRRSTRCAPGRTGATSSRPATTRTRTSSCSSVRAAAGRSLRELCPRPRHPRRRLRSPSRRTSMALATERGSERLKALLPSGEVSLVPMVLTAALGCSVCACSTSANAFAPPPPPEVTVAHPVRRSVTRYLEYTGTTEPYQSVDLRARVAGFLDQV